MSRCSRSCTAILREGTLRPSDPYTRRSETGSFPTATRTVSLRLCVAGTNHHTDTLVPQHSNSSWVSPYSDQPDLCQGISACMYQPRAPSFARCVQSRASMPSCIWRARRQLLRADAARVSLGQQENFATCSCGLDRPLSTLKTVPEYLAIPCCEANIECHAVRILGTRSQKGHADKTGHAFSYVRRCHPQVRRASI